MRGCSSRCFCVAKIPLKTYLYVLEGNFNFKVSTVVIDYEKKLYTFYEPIKSDCCREYNNFGSRIYFSWLHENTEGVRKVL